MRSVTEETTDVDGGWCTGSGTTLKAKRDKSADICATISLSGDWCDDEPTSGVAHDEEKVVKGWGTTRGFEAAVETASARRLIAAERSNEEPRLTNAGGLRAFVFKTLRRSSIQSRKRINRQRRNNRSKWWKIKQLVERSATQFNTKKQTTNEINKFSSINRNNETNADCRKLSRYKQR